MNRVPYLNRVFSVLLCTVLFCSCSSSKTPSVYEGYPVQEGARKEEFRVGLKDRSRHPWELWAYYRDLAGNRLGNAAIVEGDERMRMGQVSQALSTYLKVPQKTLVYEDRAALEYRIAGVLLSLGRPQEALARLGRYFAATNTSSGQVGPYFSVMLGWAYSQNDNQEQALSWFSRAHSLSRSGDNMGVVARQGVEMLLSSLPEEKFEEIAGVWAGDSFIANLIGSERHKRRLPGYQGVSRPYRIESGPSSNSAPAVVAAEAPKKVVVLLPLSGNYGALGKKTQNGIRLALGTGTAGDGDFSFYDSSPDPVQATTQVRELIGGGGVVAILGPLLSEPAAAVSEVARINHVPILNLSKRDNFQTGEGVFRLGVTNRSQVQSLLNDAVVQLGLSRFAMVYPNDQTGQQFAAEFRQEARARALNILFEAPYQKGDLPALVSLASQAEAYDVDGIFFPDNLTNAARFFSSLSPQFRSKVRPLGTANWDNRADLMNSREALDRAVFVTPFFQGGARPITAKFIEAYRAAYGEAPDFLAAQGFDAATLLTAVRKRQEAQNTEFEQALRSIDAYEGVTGTIRIDPSGEIFREYVVAEFRDGAVQELPSPADGRKSPLYEAGKTTDVSE